MPKRKIFDEDCSGHFVSFACYKRRKLLFFEKTKYMVLEYLRSEATKHNAKVIGFVIMPDHVHALVWFEGPGHLSSFMRGWKRNSSYQIKEFLKDTNYAKELGEREPVWQAGYYDFNVTSTKKMNEKLDYIHNNPVVEKLVKDPCDWEFSSAAWYEKGKSVGVKIGFE